MGQFLSGQWSVVSGQMLAISVTLISSGGGRNKLRPYEAAVADPEISTTKKKM